MADLRDTIGDTRSTATDRLFGFNFLNIDVRSFNSSGTYDVYLLNATTDIIIGNSGSQSFNNATGNAKVATGVAAQSGLVSLNTAKM